MIRNFALKARIRQCNISGGYRIRNGRAHSFKSNILLISGIMASGISYGSMIADNNDPARFLRSDYDENAKWWHPERQLKTKYHLIMMYWELHQRDKMMEIVADMTEKEISDLNLEYYISQYYYVRSFEHKSNYDMAKYIEWRG